MFTCSSLLIIVIIAIVGADDGAGSSAGEGGILESLEIYQILAHGVHETARAANYSSVF